MAGKIDDRTACKKFGELKDEVPRFRASLRLAPQAPLFMRQISLANHELGDRAVRALVEPRPDSQKYYFWVCHRDGYDEGSNCATESELPGRLSSVKHHAILQTRRVSEHLCHLKHRVDQRNQGLELHLMTLDQRLRLMEGRLAVANAALAGFLPPAISKGGHAVKAMTSAVVQAREEEEDLDSFLAGGRRMAVQAAKVMEDKKTQKKKLVIEQASSENLQRSADAARKAEAERQAQAQKEAEARLKEEERRKREPSRRDLHRALRAQILFHVRPAMAQIPPYTDDFFKGEPGLLAEIIGFYQRLRWAQFLFFPPSWVSVLCCTPCFLNQNIEWDTRSRHLALTVDGIKFVHAKRPTLCGLSCTDKGKESKTATWTRTGTKRNRPPTLRRSVGSQLDWSRNQARSGIGSKVRPLLRSMSVWVRT
eukprot:g18969.t1